MTFLLKSARVAAVLVCGLLQMAILVQGAELKQALFNGRDLSGWVVPDPNPFWRVADGVVVGQNDEKLKGHVLYTRESFQDFVLEVEVRWEGEIDSGVMFRKPELQLQFGVSCSLKTDMTGSFYTGGADKYPEAGRARDWQKHFKAGDWNTIRLEAKGSTFTVWLNGHEVTKYSNLKYPGAGPIGLQIHPGLKMKVEFRSVRLQRL